MQYIFLGGQPGRGCLASNMHSIGVHGTRHIQYHDIDDVWTGGKIAALGLIGQGAILVKADLMFVCVALACSGSCLSVHLLVKVEQILEQWTPNADAPGQSLGCVLVVDHTQASSSCLIGPGVSCAVLTCLEL